MLIEKTFTFGNPMFAKDVLQNLDFVTKWKKAGDVLHNTGGYVLGKYLQRFKRETDENYAIRQKASKNILNINKKLTRYIGYLYKEPPTRITNNKLLEKFISDCDGAGNNLNTFMSNFAKDAKIRGAGLVFVDFTQRSELTPTTSLTQQIEDRILPTITFIPPEQIANLQMDNCGNITQIGFWDTLNDLIVIKVIDKQRIYYTSTAGEELINEVSVNHGLDICPVIPFGENGKFPTVGEFTILGDLGVEHFNLRSELRLILADQTFSLLTVEKKGGDTPDLEVGTSNVLYYAEDANPPSFISPDPKQAEVYQSEIQNIEQTINDICYDLTNVNSAESGIALDIKFQGLNSSLNNFAQKLEELEYKIFKIVCNYLYIECDIEILYNKDFNITDVNKEVNELASVKDLGYDVPTFEYEKLKRIVNKSLPDATNESLNAIYEEMRDSLKGVM